MITQQIETITPAIAAEYLKNNTNNRPLKNQWVTDIANMIRRGQWVLDGNPIRFSEDGVLLDGQHRLQAIIRAGIPVQTLVVRGLPKESFKNIDTGRGRSGGDILSIDGCANATAASSSILGYLNLQKNNAILYGYRTNSQISNLRCGVSKGDIVAFYRENKELVTRTAEDAKGFGRGYGGVKLFPASFYGAYILYLVLKKGYDYDFVTNFFKQVITGRDVTNGTIFLLRNAIINHNSGQRDKLLTARQRVVYLTKTWNAYVTGKELKLLNYRKETEETLDFIANDAAL